MKFDSIQTAGRLLQCFNKWKIDYQTKKTTKLNIWPQLFLLVLMWSSFACNLRLYEFSDQIRMEKHIFDYVVENTKISNNTTSIRGVLWTIHSNWLIILPAVVGSTLTISFLFLFECIFYILFAYKNQTFDFDVSWWTEASVCSWERFLFVIKRHHAQISLISLDNTYRNWSESISKERIS